MLFTRIKIRCGGGIISLFAAGRGPTNLVKKTKSQPFPTLFSFFPFLLSSSSPPAPSFLSFQQAMTAPHLCPSSHL